MVTVDAASPTIYDVYNAIGFDPTMGGRNVIQPRILACQKRFILVVGGPRAGKSACAGGKYLDNWSADMARFPDFGDGTSPPLLYWLVGAAYSETRKEFPYITGHRKKRGVPVTATKPVNPGEIRVQYKGEDQPRVLIETKSGTDITKLSADAPHGIIVCEASQIDIVVFERVQERLLEHDGWLFMSGTLEEDKPWYGQLATAWASGAENRQSFQMPTWANVVVFPGGRKDPKILDIEQNSTDRFFQMRMAGEAVPPHGVVFSGNSQVRADIHVKATPIVWDEPLFLWEDPGYGHNHAVEVFQYIDGQIQGKDEVYENGLVHEEVIQICMNRPWWKHTNKILTSDPHYKDQHHSMSSVSEVWMQVAKLFAFGKKVKITEGIERFATFLIPHPISGRPGMVFHPSQRGLLAECGIGINPVSNTLTPYVYRTDNAGNTVGDTPVDANNDAIKAVTYGLIQEFGFGHVRNVFQARQKVW